MHNAPARSHGARRRDEILDFAIDVASAEGLEGLSIARLADEVGISKSGLFAHFGSKEELQLATLRAAADVFQREVIAPTHALEPGVARLRALVDAWARYVESTAYRGGCFFAAASAEFTGRAGPVREALAELTGGWVATLEREARTALRLGELPASTDPATLAFRLHAYVQEANWARELLGDERAFAKARTAIDAALVPTPLIRPARRRSRSK